MSNRNGRDPTNLTPKRLGEMLSKGRDYEVERFREMMRRTTAVIVHPEDLRDPALVMALENMRPGTKILPDERVERGRLYCIDETAIDGFGGGG